MRARVGRQLGARSGRQLGGVRCSRERAEKSLLVSLGGEQYYPTIVKNVALALEVVRKHLSLYRFSLVSAGHASPTLGGVRVGTRRKAESWGWRAADFASLHSLRLFHACCSLLGCSRTHESFTRRWARVKCALSLHCLGPSPGNPREQPCSRGPVLDLVSCPPHPDPCVVFVVVWEV